MKIELHDVQVIDRMSRETTCFVGSLYLDGKRIGNVENDGQGGMTVVRVADPDLRARLEREAVPLCRPITFGGFTYRAPTRPGPEALAWLVDQLLRDRDNPEE